MNIRRTVLNLFLTLFAAALILSANASGPDKLRYSVDAAMTSSGVDADAVGRVQALERNNGRADQQRLRITASQLDANKTYLLLAQLGESSDWTVVTSFKTSARGRGRVTYVQTAAGNNRRALPDGLEVVTDARVLAIADENGYVILSVNLHEANTMKFELASVFENAGTDMLAVGCVAVACERGAVQFRLFAAAQSSQLTFLVNDSAVATYAPDSTGLFRAGALPVSAPSPLLFRKMTLRNVNEQVVLQTDVR